MHSQSMAWGRVITEQEEGMEDRREEEAKVQTYPPSVSSTRVILQCSRFPVPLDTDYILIFPLSDRKSVLYRIWLNVWQVTLFIFLFIHKNLEKYKY